MAETDTVVALLPEPVAFTSDANLQEVRKGRTGTIYGKQDEFLPIALYAAPPTELARLQAENEALRRERGGLATMLEQTADRLVHVLGDNPKISFILTMRDSAKRLRAALEAK